MFDSISISGCLLCDEVRGENPLSTRLGLCATAADRVIMETDNFLLLPDLSPVVPGHSLLISKDHLSCFARLPTRMLQEFYHVKNRAVSHVATTYNAPLLFEHGSSGATPQSGVCVQHAHIHLVPLLAPVEDWLEGFGEVSRHDLFALGSDRCDLPEDYLWYQSQTGSEYFVSSFTESVPCQFIRRALARHFAIPAWNWKAVLARLHDGQTASSYVG